MLYTDPKAWSYAMHDIPHQQTDWSIPKSWKKSEKASVGDTNQEDIY